ncbi:flavin monoamine oxidase family protein [Aspergillus ruber CBS 135680]|uniref:Amine oxidase domain-containing protein n=1 Tax=Aspergillus ruber (strain CBS 135680) TaxID=1388766 RepID=A0A017S1P6_ASPRC|nr:uncharacterized protein EURHEDRAFT_468089 [Aspergillus ruber CBS 135680]EYE90055.1 hypothetical protein EURHEDRAFT_468089 [Aspergillus ruber CBS 135680]
MDKTLDPKIKEWKDIRNEWALKHAEEAIKNDWNDLVKQGTSIGTQRSPFLSDDHELPDPVDKLVGDKPKPSEPAEDIVLNIGIIGAGAAGLFTGLLLDFLNKKYQEKFKTKKVQFKYDILEASERVGGRLFTYNFDDSPINRDGSVNRNYYDVGAMRFPDNPVMERTFRLFNFLEMHKAQDTQGAKLGDLLPYYIKGDKEPWHFNGTTKWGDYASISAQGLDPWKLNEDGKIPEDILKKPPSDVFNDIIKTFREKLMQDKATSNKSSEGWKYLMEYDDHSTRSYLAVGTEWYDQALSEAVLESLDFDWKPGTDWRCILGGSGVLADKMVQKLKNPLSVERSTAVTKIKNKGEQQVEIAYEKANIGPQSHTYNAVFSSVPLGCLQRIDTSEAKLNYGVRQAMRALSYGPSGKVGIKFRNPWWLYKLNDANLKHAGLGHSDLSIRTCVYPSYNLQTPEEEEAVLLCSYTWQQDALRLSSLVSKSTDLKNKWKEETELKNILIHDLARLHAGDDSGKTVPELEEIIGNSYLEHFAFDWYQNPHSVGAFAFFGPQQFRSSWPKIIQPSGDLAIIGEAASPHHAWVVGALESAVHQVYSWLNQHKDKIHGFSELAELLENDPPADDLNPFQGLPPYMRTETCKWQSVLAKAYREMPDCM